MRNGASATTTDPHAALGPVWAVVVTYRPDLGTLNALLDALAPQVAGAVIVDNGSGEAVQAVVARRAAAMGGEAVAWPDNRGLGAAQGEGIARARARGARAVVLFDQDSLPAPDMVARLLGALATLRARGKRVAALGPRFEDLRRPGGAAFLSFGWRGARGVPPEPGTGLAPVDFVISSGALLPVDALDAVGPPLPDLFIDHVDTEWGYRARALGWQSFGVEGARMDHSIGEATAPILGRRMIVHPPARAFFQVRNWAWLLGQPHVPLPWKLRFGLRIGLALLVLPDRRARARASARGLARGLRGRLGPL
jgi:rhamnosyltransferase